MMMSEEKKISTDFDFYVDMIYNWELWQNLWRMYNSGSREFAARKGGGDEAFIALWGEAMAQLRQFQDGAIVRHTRR